MLSLLLWTMGAFVLGRLTTHIGPIDRFLDRWMKKDEKIRFWKQADMDEAISPSE